MNSKRNFLPIQRSFERRVAHIEKQLAIDSQSVERILSIAYETVGYRDHRECSVHDKIKFIVDSLHSKNVWGEILFRVELIESIEDALDFKLDCILE